MSVITSDRARFAISSRFNPIRELKPQSLAAQLDMYDRGRPRHCALLWEQMEERDLLLLNVASKRKQAVSRAQWEVLTIDDSPEARQQKEVLEVFYNNLVATNVLKQNERGGMGLLQRQMMDAVGKGFSVHEIVWKPLKGQGTQRSLNRKPIRQSQRTGNAPDASGGPGFTGGEFLTATFTHCPLQFFENITGRLRFLKNDYDTEGQEMKEAEWLVTCARPLMKATSIGYVYKHLPLKFWVGFCERHGFPGVLAKVPNKPGDAEWDAAEAAVARFMNEFGAVMNTETVMELIETKGGAGALPFPGLVDYIDRQFAALWRGADLSTISQGKGDGTGASVQADETNLLQEDDAGLVTETFWDQVDKQVLWAALGVDAPLAYVKILPPKKQAVDQDIKIDEFLAKWGVKLSVDDALERYGRGQAEGNEPVLTQPQPSPGGGLPGQGSSQDGPQTQMENETLWRRFKNFIGLANEAAPEKKLLAAKKELFAPVLERLQRIEALDDPMRKRGALISLLAELPALGQRMEREAGDGAMAETLANEMKAALVKGFADGKKKDRKEKP